MTNWKMGALLALVGFCVMVGAMFAQGPVTSQARESGDHAINVRFEDLKWDRMVPELAERSPEMAILRVDSQDQGHAADDPRAREHAYPKAAYRQ